MKKFLKCIIIILLSVILIVVGCIIANNIYKKKKYIDFQYEQIVRGRELAAENLKRADIEELKSREEDKSLIKEKEEFMQLFKVFCGFSLPEYFIFPKDIDKLNIQISERTIEVTDYFVFEKNDALEMLNYLRNDNSWTAFSSIAGAYIRTPELRELCNTFEKSYKYDETINNFNMVVLDFLYDEESNYYVMYMNAGLERDPPPGTSWPDISWTIH